MLITLLLPLHARAGAPFETAEDVVAALRGAKTTGQVDAVWRQITALGPTPLVFDDTAVFLYRGKASSVAWVGDFTTWRSGEPLVGERVAADIWLASAQFPRDARFDYKVRVNGKEKLDPLNPRKQLGMYGYNSVVAMPGYVASLWTQARTGVAKGQVSAPFTLYSKSLGYGKRFTVYTPPGADTLKNLPVLYLTDGQQFSHAEMGSLPTVLDNLIAAGRIRPVIAVFVDSRDASTDEDKRGPELLTNPRFQAFLTKELVPWIDSRYPTRPLAESRALAGMSLGGLHATYTAMRQPDTFGLVGILSPYFLAKPAVLTEVEKAKRQPVKLFISQGTYDYDVDNTRHLRDVLRTKGYAFKYMETHDGHSWGNWRNALDDMLVYFFGL